MGDTLVLPPYLQIFPGEGEGPPTVVAKLGPAWRPVDLSTGALLSDIGALLSDNSHTLGWRLASPDIQLARQMVGLPPLPAERIAELDAISASLTFTTV
jgi:hypothetical protein